MTNIPATRKDIDDIIDILRDHMQHVDRQLGEIRTEIVDLKTSHNHLLNTIDAFIARIDHYETEQAARDSQFEKLLAWARKVSEKTGIPLDNL